MDFYLKRMSFYKQKPSFYKKLHFQTIKLDSQRVLFQICIKKSYFLKILDDVCLVLYQIHSDNTLIVPEEFVFVQLKKMALMCYFYLCKQHLWKKSDIQAIDLSTKNIEVFIVSLKPSLIIEKQ